MEQKQLDELDESYFGEEFVDEESLVKNSKEKPVSEEIKIESLETESKGKKRSSSRKAAKSALIDASINLTKTVESAVETKASEVESIEKPKVEIIDEVKPTLKETVTKETSTNYRYNSNNSVSETSSEGKSTSKFNLEQVSTWKMITGVVIILLILSVFTQGFNFGEEQVSGAAVAGKILPLEEAEWRALRYINENLLKPPYIATIDSSKELPTVYRLDLSVGDEKVVSYLTKDGRYLFPQGIDITYYLTVEEVPKKEKSLDPSSDTENSAVVSVPADSASNGQNERETVETNPEVKDTVNENSPSTFTLTAKKWLFSPHQIVVKQGDTATLLIEPENLDFTFSIPELKVEKSISGPTEVTFKAEKAGSFEFICSSCEDWRGMKGTLVVE